MGDKDPFRDLTFTGSPSEYRLFRRKILLSVASLEEKHVHLAGPRILSRLSGEAWRATEHLSIGDVRSEKGWLCVLRALDDHYRYLPETELNECVDEFLFHLKRRAHEGPTAFVSRFKAVLNRLESLVASEKAAQKGSTKRRRAANKKDSSSSGSSSDSFGSGPAADEPRLTKEKVEAASSAAPAATTRTTEGPAPDSKGPRTVGSFVESPKKKPPSSGGGSHYSRGTHKADEDKAQRRMLENLGKLEAGHLRVRPIFPEVILGHLFMRKYGLTREQRSQVIRSTGGSCRFKDVEKVIRASDYEDKTADPHGRGSAPRANRSGNVMAAEEDSSLSEPSLSGDEVCEAEDESADTEDREELEEAYEVQKKAKQDAKKAYRNYKDSRKRVREIKKDRQPYMPVVAIPPPTSAPLPGDGQPIQPTFKYDRKTGRMDKAKGGGKRGRREDVSLVQSELVTEFSYMVTTEDADEHDVYSVTVPAGLAVIDTGCTTSVIGEETAARYTEYFRNRGLPEPVAVTLPPVQLKGFNGLRTATERGLRWTVKLGSLWGQITTYMVEGSAPFLLSRKVLQGMEATLDLGKCTLTSAKHGLHDEPLAQAGNGHLLLPLVPPDEAEDLLAVGDCPPVAYPCAPPDPKSALATPEIPTDDQTSPKEVTNSDLRRYFQTIMKHTRYSQVDVGTHRYQLRMLFGEDVDFALCAYRPRFERMPKQAASHHMYARVAHLTPGGVLEHTSWKSRESSARRAAFDRPGACIFAYRYERPAASTDDNLLPSPKDPKAHNLVDRVACSSGSSDHATCHTRRVTPPSETCDCCATEATTAGNPSCPDESPMVSQDLEAVYEELDWVCLEHLPLPAKCRSKIASQVEAVRRVPFQLALANLESNPQQVREELSEWLGKQASLLKKRVGLIEVFAGSASLSHQCERTRGLASICLGPAFGQDFSRARDRRLLLLLIGLIRTKDVWFSWPCNSWSGWSRRNLAKGGNAARNVLARRKKERPFLHLFEQAWSLQTMLGGHIHAENPVASLAWNEMSLGPAYEVDFDLCAVGLVDKSSGMPIQRPTRVVTSDPQLVSALRVCQCPGHSAHAHVADSAQSPSLTYPRQFCRNIATALACRDTDVTPDHDIFVQTDDEADSERESDQEGDPDEAPRMREANRRSYAAMIQKLHVNTGHASVPQMLRLAQQAKAPAALVAEIRKFRCPVCEELQVPPSHRVAALRHTETPNHIVGLDVVQVELKRDGPEGVIETKYNVLTAVDYASDFSQQIVLPAGPGVVSKAFHAMWCRPYGPPRVIYVDPDQRWMSGEFQEYLKHNSITLLDCAAESHWQLGRVEVAQRILRNMAQRVWRTTQRPAEEVIESCCAVRNEQLKRHGFSSAQWFLGRDPRVPGSLSDLTEQKNVAVQDAVLSERDFAQKMQVRQQAAEAFIGAHAHDAWTRAIKGRSRPIRGPYVVGQSVYVFRRQGRGQLNTRHGAWLGPGRVVGTESFREDSPIPRVIWVVVNGFMYKCSPECLRPVAEDEVAFRHAAQEFHTGRLAEELEQATPSRRGPAGRFFDLTREPPSPEDFLTPPASDVEGEDNLENSREETTRNVRRRVTISDAEWERRAAQTSPRGGATIRNREEADPTAVDVEHPADKAPRLSPEDLASDLDLEMYVPSPAEEQFPEILGPDAGAAPSAAAGEPLDNPAQEPLPSDAVLCCEVALDIFDVDLDPQGNGLWKALEECAVVAARPGQKRRVEVSFRKLGPEDREKFRGAMKKEWQSWLENKVTTIAKGKGVPKSRIIGSRWVLTWKKSSDPDDRTLSAKARLVLVGFQDPDLGRIAIDSPTLRKESKHVILSICASKGWVIWGADIKTAFLSGDQSDRQLYFRPPPEVRELMNLSDDDVLRLNKAAYGLAEAPRAWFLRLTRELLAVGLTVSQLDPCVFCLRTTALMNW